LSRIRDRSLVILRRTLVEKKEEQVGERPLSARHFSASNAISRVSLLETVTNAATRRTDAPMTLISSKRIS